MIIYRLRAQCRATSSNIPMKTPSTTPSNTATATPSEYTTKLDWTRSDRSFDEPTVKTQNWCTRSGLSGYISRWLSSWRSAHARLHMLIGSGWSKLRIHAPVSLNYFIFGLVVAFVVDKFRICARSNNGFSEKRSQRGQWVHVPRRHSNNFFLVMFSLYWFQ